MLSRDVAGIQLMSKKNRHLVLAGANRNVNAIVKYHLIPPSLRCNFACTPSAVIERGGKVGFSLVPHRKLVAYKSYI